jgi:hypothetical protein
VTVVIVGLAAAYAAGVDLRRIGLLAATAYFPWAVAVAVVWVAWKMRPDEDQRPSMFCEGVAAELRAGATLRIALASASASVGCADSVAARFRAGPISEVAATADELFPGIGDELALTIVNAWRSGSQAADLFEEIASLAIAQSEIRREVRIATAPGRATAMLLVAAPAAYLLSRASSGDIEQMVESGQQRVAVLAGLALFLLGAAAATVVVWRASK